MLCVCVCVCVCVRVQARSFLGLNFTLSLLRIWSLLKALVGAEVVMVVAGVVMEGGEGEGEGEVAEVDMVAGVVVGGVEAMEGGEGEGEGEEEGEGETHNQTSKREMVIGHVLTLSKSVSVMYVATLVIFFMGHGVLCVCEVVMSGTKLSELLRSEETSVHRGHLNLILSSTMYTIIILTLVVKMCVCVSVDVL